MEFYTEYVYASRFVLAVVVFTVLLVGLAAGWVLRGLGDVRGGGPPPAPPPSPRPLPPRVDHRRGQPHPRVVMDAHGQVCRPDRALTPRELSLLRKRNRF